MTHVKCLLTIEPRVIKIWYSIAINMYLVCHNCTVCLVHYNDKHCCIVYCHSQYTDNIHVDTGNNLTYHLQNNPKDQATNRHNHHETNPKMHLYITWSITAVKFSKQSTMKTSFISHWHLSCKTYPGGQGNMVTVIPATFGNSTYTITQMIINDNWYPVYLCWRPECSNSDFIVGIVHDTICSIICEAIGLVDWSQHNCCWI